MKLRSFGVSNSTSSVHNYLSYDKIHASKIERERKLSILGKRAKGDRVHARDPISSTRNCQRFSSGAKKLSTMRNEREKKREEEMEKENDESNRHV